MNTIEKELKKILHNQCPVKNLETIIETTDKNELNPDLLIESIDILKMHEEEMRRFRQGLELLYQDRIIGRYIAKKNSEKHTRTEG